MKTKNNLFLVAALALGTMTAFAQEGETTVQDPTTETVATQDGFNEIAADKIPQAVSDALAKDYPNATISKAYMNEESQYKLEVALKDGSSAELYADAEGNWIDM